MTIVRSILRPITRPIARPINGITGAIRRVFITLDPVANAYYELASPWTPTGDYSIEADVYFNDEPIRITGNNSNFNSRLVIAASGQITWRADTSATALETGQGVVPSNKLSTIKVVRTGTSGEIFVNGASITTGAVPTGTLDLENFGRNSTSYSDGIISNVKLTDLSTPSNSESYGLNQLTGDIEFTGNNVFGAELWLNPTLGGWTDGGGGTYSLVGDGTLQWLNIASGTLDPVVVTFTVDALSANCKVQTTNGGKFIFTTTGTYTVIVNDHGGSIGFSRNSGVANATLSNISVKQVTNVITYVNIAETIDVRDTFTLVDEGWTGSELVVNGSFNTDTAWSKAAGMSISGGQFIFDNVANTIRTAQSLAFSEGLTYITTLDIASVDLGALRIRFPYISGNYSVSGIVSFSGVADASGEISIQAQGDTTAAVNSISVKQLIEVAP